MIKKNIVFVLGAGAHQPYGFPHGSGLVDNILKSIPAPDQGPTAFSKMLLASRGLHSKDLTPRALVEFREALDLGGHTSIDSFLHTHSHRPGFTEIGKLAVAFDLLPEEYKHRWQRRPHDGDWMSFLFQSMLHGCTVSIDAFLDANKVSFVTFNYDRTLEYFLSVRIAHTFTLPIEQAWEKAKHFPLVHVYGSLGAFQPQAINAIRLEQLEPRVIRDAASCIRLMYEDRVDQPEIQQAMDLISQASLVCFLGFGFDPDNIVRLKLHACCESKPVIATRYKVKDGDWGRVRANMSPCSINLGLNGHQEQDCKNWDCLSLLHELVVF